MSEIVDTTTRPSAPQLKVNLSHVVAVVVILLVITNALLYYKLQQTIVEYNTGISNLEESFSQEIDQVMGRQTQQANVINALDADIGIIARELSSVASLAENANNYAHSHSSFSDVRLKEEIVSAPNQLDNVLALEVVSYKWRVDDFSFLAPTTEPEIGLLAQDVERIYPNLVSVAPNGYKRIDYERLVPILIQAIQDQQAQIEALQP